MNTDPISAAHAYRQALEKITSAPSLTAAIRTARNALAITIRPPEEGNISIHSGYGHTTRTPFVTFALANPSESANPQIQMSSHEARRQAHYILEAADAAESDGFIVEWLGQAMGIDLDTIGKVLAEFRAFREQQRGKEKE